MSPSDKSRMRIPDLDDEDPEMRFKLHAEKVRDHKTDKCYSTKRPTNSQMRISTSQALNNVKQVGPQGVGIADAWNVGGRTRALMYDPTDPKNKRVIAGMVSGGLWLNQDISDPNSIWTPLGNDTLPHYLGVVKIVHDPHPDRLTHWYVVTGELSVIGLRHGSIGNGLWRTLDSGSTWERLDQGLDTEDIWIDGTFANALNNFWDVALRDNGNEQSTIMVLDSVLGLMFSTVTDNTGSYSDFVNVTGADSSCRSILISKDGKWSPVPNNTVLISTSNGQILEYNTGKNTISIFKDVSSSITVERTLLIQGKEGQIALIQARTSSFLGLATQAIEVRVLSNNNDHITGAVTGDDVNQLFYNLSAVFETGGQNLLVGEVDILRIPFQVTADGTYSGGSECQLAFVWSSINGAQSHADNHVMVPEPNGGPGGLIGSDGGVFWCTNFNQVNTSNSPSGCVARNKEYFTLQANYGATSPNPLRPRYIVGCQDNSTIASTTKEPDKNYYMGTQVMGGDGNACYIDDNIILATVQYGLCDLYDSNGSLVNQVFSQDVTTFFITPLLTLKQEDGSYVLYTGGSNNAGFKRAKISPNPIAYYSINEWIIPYIVNIRRICLDTPSVKITKNNKYLHFACQYWTETPSSNQNPKDSFKNQNFDGWDGFNMQISSDGGISWKLLGQRPGPYTQGQDGISSWKDRSTNTEITYFSNMCAGMCAQSGETDETTLVGNDYVLTSSFWGGENEALSSCWFTQNVVTKEEFLSLSIDLTDFIGQEVMVRYCFGTDWVVNSSDGGMTQTSNKLQEIGFSNNPSFLSTNNNIVDLLTLSELNIGSINSYSVGVPQTILTDIQLSSEGYFFTPCINMSRTNGIGANTIFVYDLENSNVIYFKDSDDVTIDDVVRIPSPGSSIEIYLTSLRHYEKNGVQSLIATSSRYGYEHVWYIPDLTNPQWETKSTNLVDIPVWDSLQSKIDPDTVILATEFGIYVTRNFTSTDPVWNKGVGGIPRTACIYQFDRREADGEISVITYGNSVFTGYMVGESVYTNTIDQIVNSVNINTPRYKGEEYGDMNGDGVIDILEIVDKIILS